MKPDIIHLFGLYSVNSLGLLPFLSAVSNLVVSPWGTDIVYDFSQKESYKSKFQKSYLLKQADCITSLSHYLINHIRKYIRDDQQVELVPWGADTNVFHPRYLRNNSRIFTVGITKAFTRKYGHIHLLDAVSELINKYRVRNIKLIIVGKGVLEDELKKKCHELNLHQYVVFKKYTYSEIQLRDHLSAFDVYVMPSVYKSETLGVAAIEASAMGIPVVASNIGGIPEVVKHNVTGLLTPPGDAEAIAIALLRLMKYKELRHQMGQAARKRAESLFSFQDSVAKMIACYSRLMNQNDNWNPS